MTVVAPRLVHARTFTADGVVVPPDDYAQLVSDLASMGATVSRAFLADDGLVPGGNWVDKVSGQIAPAQGAGLAVDANGAYPASAGGYCKAPVGAAVAGAGKMFVYIGNTAGGGSAFTAKDPSAGAASTSGSLTAITLAQTAIQSGDPDQSANKVRLYMGGGSLDLGGNAVYAPNPTWGFAGDTEPIGDAGVHCLTMFYGSVNAITGRAVEQWATMDGWRSSGRMVDTAFSATLGPYELYLGDPSASASLRFNAVLELDVPDAATVVGNAIVQRVNTWARLRYNRAPSPFAGKIVVEQIGDSFTEASRIPTDFGLPVDTYGPTQAAAAWLRANGYPNVVARAKGRSGRSWRTYNTGDPADPAQDTVQDISIAQCGFWEWRLADVTADLWLRSFQEDYNANRNSGATAADLAANIQGQALAVVQRSRAYLGTQANVRHLLLEMGPSRLERLAGTADALHAQRAALAAGTMGERISTVLYVDPKMNPFTTPANFCTSDGGIHPDANGSLYWGQQLALLDLLPLIHGAGL